jgi:DNA-binding transcriptional regulator YdaS (Cro superfamily)
MHSLADLFDLARKHSNLPSDYRIAQELNVAPQQVSQWRHGSHVMQGRHAPALAKLCGLSTEYVLVCVINAEAKRSDEERQVLRQIAGQLKKTAAALVLGIAAILGVFSPQPALAAIVDVQAIHIMVNYR